MAVKRGNILKEQTHHMAGEGVFDSLQEKDLLKTNPLLKHFSILKLYTKGSTIVLSTDMSSSGQPLLDILELR